MEKIYFHQKSKDILFLKIFYEDHTKSYTNDKIEWLSQKIEVSSRSKVNSQSSVLLKSTSAEEDSCSWKKQMSSSD